MVRYITDNWSHRISRVEVARETDRCYFISGPQGREDRRLKNPRHYHMSYADARAALISQEMQKVESCRYSLEIAEKHLEAAERLPEVEP